MSLKSLFLLWLTLATGYCLLTPAVAAAADQFRTRIQITYEFALDGTSKITQEYSLTNLTSQTTASAYEFDILDVAPQNLTAYDHHGQLSLKTVTTGTGPTRVLIPFNQLTAGKGRTYSFFLSYTGPSVFQVDGLWRISLPVTTAEADQEITLVLNVPDKFGQPLTLYPTTTAVSKKTGRIIYTFSAAQLESVSALYAIFGNLSLVGFKIDYLGIRRGQHLEMPADKPGQIVFIQKIDPVPQTITAQEDGKWVVKYASAVSQAEISGYILVDATASASFPDTGQLSLTNLTLLPQTKPSLPQIRWTKPWQLFPFITLPSFLTITNSGSQAIYHLAISVFPNHLASHVPVETLVPVIPPFGQVTLPIKLTTPFLPGLTSHQLTISAGSNQVTYNIDAGFFVMWYVFLTLTIVAAFVALGLITHFGWRLYFQKRRR